MMGLCGSVRGAGVEGGRGKKKETVGKPRKVELKKKIWLKRNNKKRLKNNILIRIEF